MKTTKKLKTIALSMGLGVVMLTSTSVQAQALNLLDEYYEELEQQSIQRDKNTMAVGRNLLRTSPARSAELVEGFNINVEGFGGDNGGSGGGYSIGTEEFGAPLGSGLFIMAAAGAAYAFSKKRKKQEVRR